MKDLETKLKELPQLCIDEKTDDANMMSSKRLGSQRRQVRPSSAADAEEEGCSSSYDYRPKSKRDATSSSRRASRCIDNKTGPHRRTATNDADIKLVNDRDRDHLQHQLKQHRHHHELQQQQRSSTRRRPSAEEQSFSNSIETTSTHPSTSYEDYLIADDEEVYYDHHDEDDGYYGHHGKSCSSTSRSNTSRSLARRRRGSRSPSTSRSSSRLSSSNNHHRRHHDYHSSSSSPSRDSSRRLPPLPRRRPSPEDGLRSSFGSNSHDSHRSSRTLPSSYHDKPRDARPPIRRRSSDDLCALESSNSSRRSISRYHHHHDRRRREGCSHRSLSSSSSRRDYSRDSEDHDDPSVNTAVKLRVSSRSSSRQHLKDSSNSRRIIHDDDKTPRKHNHTTNNKKKNNNNNNKKNSIDLTIDSNGQGTFTVTSSPSTAPLQFDIQIDEHHSSYLIQTSLGLLHQIRSVHSSKNTNILRTLSHWNSYYEGKEKQNGYCRGQLGIVSMSPSSFTTKHDVVLMTLTGSYHHGSSSSPSSSFEDDDVFIKELELFVTDSLWCYLRLHGLVEEEEDGRGSDYLGNSDHHEECDQVRNLRAEFHNKNGRKKERVLSRVFKRVIGE